MRLVWTVDGELSRRNLGDMKGLMSMRVSQRMVRHEPSIDHEICWRQPRTGFCLSDVRPAWVRLIDNSIDKAQMTLLAACAPKSDALNYPHKLGGECN